MAEPASNPVSPEHQSALRAETLIPQSPQRPEQTGNGLRELLNIPRCQYGVFSYEKGVVVSCDEPATAKWTWAASLFVCEKHDAALLERASELGEPTLEPVATTKPKARLIP